MNRQFSNAEAYLAQSTGSNKISKTALIAKQIKILFAAYRPDQYADPDGFLAQLGLVLEGYEGETIIAVTDPRAGIQRRSKWPPTIAEVVEACDAENIARATRERYSRMPSPKFHRVSLPPDRRPGRRANVLIPRDSDKYARAVAISEKADEADWKWDEQGLGIWLTLNLFDHAYPVDTQD